MRKFIGSKHVYDSKTKFCYSDDFVLSCKFWSTDNVVSSFFATLCHVTGCSCDCRTHCCGTNSVQRWLMERGVKKP